MQKLPWLFRLASAVLFGVLGWSTTILLAQNADRFEISAPPAQVTESEAFILTIRAMRSDGSPGTNWQGEIRLLAFSPTASPPVISEVDRAGDAIEIINPGDLPVNIGDWELQVLPDYDDYSGAALPRLRLPIDTTLPPRGVITWSSHGVAPGGFPAFVSGRPLSAPGNPFQLIRLRDSNGNIVDEVYLRSLVFPPPDAVWRSPGLNSYPINVSHTRVGDANHFRSTDWTTNASTLGTLNPGLRLPWSTAGYWIDASPTRVSITNGVWTGSVALTQTAAGTVRLFADNGAGVSGWSTTFEVVSLPLLNLVLSAGLRPASEAQPGLAGLATLSIPAARTNNLTVNLRLSDTNEFQVPTQAFIPAGATSVSVPVTNYDDAFADGLAAVALSASAPGYAQATAILLNDDNEVGRLFVNVPSPLKEDSGFATQPGRVFLDLPARHDVMVFLSAEPPVEVPESVIIPAGRFSQSFWLRIGDDELANPVPWETRVWAQTAGWPAAEGIVRLLDDEDPGFEVEIPSEVVEGIPTTGLIRFRTRHAADTVFELTSDNARLQVPVQVTVPAGQIATAFFLRVPDNTQTNVLEGGTVCLHSAGLTSICRQVILADDEVEIDHLIFGWPPLLVLSGQPFPLEAALVNFSNQPQQVTVPGQLELLVAPALAQLAPGSSSIQMTNGRWNNTVAVFGEALGAELRITASGKSAVTRRFDVLAGRDVVLDFTDAVWNGAAGKFLVAESVQTNVPARLTEIDPRTGQRERSLALPRGVRRIALSDDGRVAWLASTQGTLQRVDLALWRFDREFPLSPVSANAAAWDLVVLPQQSERVVAAVDGGGGIGTELVLFDRGTNLPTRASLPGSRWSLVLVAGRTTNEVFCQSFGNLSRFNVVTNGVTLDRSVSVDSSSIEWPSLSREGDRLYRGYGDVYLADTLERLEPFPTLGSQLGASAADRGIVVFLERNGILRSFDRDDHQPLGSHSVPESQDWPLRLLRWGERGLAYFNADGKKLTIIETPLLNSTLPDLELTVQAPPLVQFLMTNGFYIPTTFNWAFAITNRGPAAALGARLDLDTGEWFELGTLAPGQGIAINLERGLPTAGIFSSRARVTSVTSDADPSDNEATAVTLGKTPDLPSSRQLILGMTHLIGSPSGTRLYASLSHSAGAVNEGVAVVDPEAGTLDQILPVGTNPQRLAISGDGSRLYVLLGSNTLARWNLSASTNELVLTLTNETILDFIVLPGAARSVVVATTARVAILDDAQPRPLALSNPLDRRHLGFAGNTLWIAEPGRLSPFTVTASGLSAGTSVPFSLSNDYYGFASDGRYLYFIGAIFDTVTRQILGTFLPGNYFLPDANSASVFATGVVPGTGINSLSRYSSQTFALQGTQPVPQAMEYLMDPVRWGQDGLAVRSIRNQLLLIHSSLIPSNIVGDLAVSLTPPVQPVPNETLEWTIVVTNRSAQAAPRTLLTVAIDGDLQEIQVEGAAFQRFFSSLYFELGDTAANSSLTIRLRGWTWQQNLTVSASLVSAAVDPTPGDNSASATVRPEYRVADLGIHSVIAPDRVQMNEEFNVTYVVTNAGPSVAKPYTVWLAPNPALEFFGIWCQDCTTNADGTLTSGDLPPGATKLFSLQLRVKEAGPVLLTAYAVGPVSDPQGENNRVSRLIYVVPPATNQVVTELNSVVRPMVLTWDRSRRQVLAVFPDDSGSLFVLSPQTLEPISEIPLGGTPRRIAPCNDGRHVWVSLAEGEAARVDLASNMVNLRFFYEPNPSSAWSIATPPDQPDVLVAALDSGNTQVRVFDHGLARSGTFGPLGWAGGGVPLLFTADGRLFLAASQILRELRLVPAGVQEVRNLDQSSGYSDLSLSYSGNRLYLGSDGRIVNLDTGTADDALRPTSPLVADVETGMAYTASGSRMNRGGPPMIIRAMDATTLASAWRLELPLPSSEAGAIVTMGTNGLIVVGEKLRLVRTALLGPRQTDLAVNVAVPAIVGGVQIDFPIQIAVTNRAVWTASETKITVRLTPGLVFADGNPGAGTNFVQLALGSLNGGTNLSLYARAATDGVHTIRASVFSDLPDTVFADNEQQATTTVLPAPILFFDDASVSEGSSSRPGMLLATLSRPAPADFSVGFTLVPLTAQAGDFSTLTGAWQFRAGESTAAAYAIRGDSGPELDESATLTIFSDRVTLARTSAVVTIANDDWPQITVTNVAINEGNSGFTNAVFRVALAQKAPFPVDVRFETLGGTANPSSDFLPREGWVHFEPNEDVKLISVPVRGDTVYEPAESASFLLLNAVNAEIGVAQAILTIRNDDLPPAPVAAISSVGVGGTQIVFQTVAGATYQLQVKTNLTTDVWRTLPTSILGDGQPSMFMLDVHATPTSYFRVFAR